MSKYIFQISSSEPIPADQVVKMLRSECHAKCDEYHVCSMEDLQINIATFYVVTDKEDVEYGAIVRYMERFGFVSNIVEMEEPETELPLPPQPTTTRVLRSAAAAAK